ncbi:GNAT family N-acetyltransferase [Nonomuraea soli]|uniref:RimJ/RimL family protein N-acetyltransferase n=1 Tax=Nonomuraea soli TaxID=1032476 RepID=A0A7W0CLP1_9ACTN|nr:GNAT family N-acetyltransferase [Nonomuraea soli]MBA2893496.1 RimJ/RimL family protein N-acetyltransferase [Nonomuraea soli]
MFGHDFEITTERLVLRRFLAGDEEQIRAILAESLPFLPPSLPADPDAVGPWIQESTDVAITDLDGRIVGATSLFKTDLDAGRTEIGYGTHPGHRGRGYMTEAVRALCAWVFEHTAINRIELTSAPGNIASLWVAQKSGFTWEGMLRRYDDEGDRVLFSLVRGEGFDPSPVLPFTEMRTERLVLRRYTEADVPALLALAQDELTLANTGLRIEDETAARALALETVERKRLRGGGIDWAVATDELVGTVSFDAVDWFHRVAEVAYNTVPGHRGRGYALEALVAVSRWLLLEQGFHRITLRAVAHNSGSQRVAEKAGYVREGVARKVLAGYDAVVYSLTAADVTLEA